MDKLMKILQEIKPNVSFSGMNQLIDEHVLDSFDIVTLVGELNEAFDVEITMEHLVPENFNSVEAMMALIESLQ